MTTSSKPLYRVLIKSLENRDGVEKLMCRECAEHARYISDSQGPRWYIQGDPFRYLDVYEEKVGGFTNFPKSLSSGECEHCEGTKRSEAMIIANIEGIPYSRALASIR